MPLRERVARRRGRSESIESGFCGERGGVVDHPEDLLVGHGKDKIPATRPRVPIAPPEKDAIEWRRSCKTVPTTPLRFENGGAWNVPKGRVSD